MRNALIFYFLLSAVIGSTQIQVAGTLIDSITEVPIAFAHVINLTDYTGTITNYKGAFDLNCYPSDTLRFQFLGYKDYQLVAAEILLDDLVKLSLDASLVEQITIVSEDGYLYDWLAKCRKNLEKDNSGVTNAKAYLNIISSSDNEPLEFIEAYYNTDLDKASVADIHFKNGKSYLMKNKYGGYFFNVDISKALNSYSLLKGHASFPANPLELSKRKLQKKFKLSLEHKTKDLIVIAFEPRDKSTDLFSGKIWINQHTHCIQAIDLKSNGNGTDVFMGLGETKIHQIKYKLKFSFIEKDASSILSYIKLNYEASIATSIDHSQFLEIETEAILHLFDYESQYVLPFFDYQSDISDYRLFSVVPKNEEIWSELESDNQIKLSKDNRVIEEKISVKGAVFTNSLPGSETFFESNYLFWTDSTRVLLKPKVNKNQEVKKIRTGHLAFDYRQKPTFEVDKLNIDVQLYLDLMPTDTGVVFSTAAILDSYNSYNELKETDELICYTNIYFDISEIYRQKLDERILASDGSINEIQAIHLSVTEEMKDKQNTFQKSAFAGTPKEELGIWNEYIVTALGIDNIGHVIARKEN